MFARLAEVIASGELGKVLTIQLSENVAFWHYAHSYVRGHTRNSVVPWLLQKSCHDLDLLQWFAGAHAAGDHQQVECRDGQDVCRTGVRAETR